MKIKVKITQKPQTVNSQDKVVLDCLRQMGFDNIKSVRVGKYLEIEMDDSLSVEERLEQIREACKTEVNPIMEDFTLEIVS